MYEPCNVLQSGHVLTSYNLFVTQFGTYAAPLPSSSYLNLGNSFAIQFILICCMSKLSQHNTSLWFHAFRFLLTQPVTCFRILKSISLMTMTIRANFPMTSSAMLKFNLELQISNPRFPLLLFTLSHTPTQTTLPFYSSLRILCKVW